MNAKRSSPDAKRSSSMTNARRSKGIANRWMKIRIDLLPKRKGWAGGVSGPSLSSLLVVDRLGAVRGGVVQGAHTLAAGMGGGVDEGRADVVCGVRFGKLVAEAGGGGVGPRAVAVPV